MSHFTVLVVGDDYEAQLAPYDEEIAVPRYKQYWDSDQLGDMEATLRNPDHQVYDPDEHKHVPGAPYTIEAGTLLPEGEYTLEQMARAHNLRYGRDERVFVDDGGIYEWSTYNPKSKWDWYQVGGRWRGYFKVKPGVDTAEVGAPGTFGNAARFDADVLRKGMVDADGMRRVAADTAGEWWDKMDALLRDTPVAKTWDECLADATPDGERHPEDVDAVSTTYGEQPRVKALREHDAKVGYDNALAGLFGDDVDDYQMGRAAYVRRAEMNAVTPYAYVVDGIWHAPGKMGWFGMSDDGENDRAHFAEQFNAMFDALPDDTLLTLVDCHI